MKTMLPMTKYPPQAPKERHNLKMRRSRQDPCSAASDLAFSSSSSGLRAGWDRSQRFGISSIISVIKSVKAAHRRKRKDSETRDDEAVVACVYPITISRQFEQESLEYCANMKFPSSCPHTIWPQLIGVENNKTLAAFELLPGNTQSVETFADFYGHIYSWTNCQINNGSSCNNINEPVTTVVFKLQVNGTDEYFVDNIDGFNLPVSVDAIGGSGSGIYRCAKAGCIGHMKGWCPPELKVQGGDGCCSACNVFHTPEYCCSHSFSTPSTCKPTSYAKVFQQVCPRSRTLPYNTDNSTSIFTCEGADYIVRFCPAAGTFSTILVGGQLRCTDRLTSTNGTFTLGFYGVHFGSLGIWYSNDENNKVWVAKPTLSTSGNHVLSIDPDTGSLIIIAGGSTLRVIADVQTGPSSNVMATLGEDGRLRLIANTTVLWQTPFHPFIQHGKTHTWVVLLVAVACGLLLLLVVVIILSYFFCKKINPPQQGDEETEMKEMVLLWSNFRFFDHESLSLATNHFSDENKIGRGGFGTVYKGTLGSGEEIAVKKLGRTSRQGRPEFNAEIKAIANAKHTSLVQVRGCCIHGSDLMLVYEYMHNKSVAYHLADEERRRALDWQTRKRIILVVAKGLRYLHMDSNMHVIHRDIKCNNILLDQNMNAKISDFGMARLLSLDETTARSQTIAGTFGYMAPECVRGGISTKCDLYSFGVVMLELVSGLRVTSRSFPDNNGSLFSYALRLWGQGELYRMKDPLMMEDDHARNELSRIVRISILCIQTKPDDRPNASTICELLTNDMPVPEPVSHRHLQFLMTPPSSSQDITESCVDTIEVGDHRIS